MPLKNMNQQNSRKLKNIEMFYQGKKIVSELEI
jgi:hypothetical protein